MIDNEYQWYGVRCDECGRFLAVSDDARVTVATLLEAAQARHWVHRAGSFGKGEKSHDTCSECMVLGGREG